MSITVHLFIYFLLVNDNPLYLDSPSLASLGSAILRTEENISNHLIQWCKLLCLDSPYLQTGSSKPLWNKGDLYRFPILDHHKNPPRQTNKPISFFFNSYQPDVGASNLEANLRSPRWFSTTDSVVSPEAYQETRQDSTPDGRCGPTIVNGAYGTPKWKYMANWGDVTLLIGLL